MRFVGLLALIFLAGCFAPHTGQWTTSAMNTAMDTCEDLPHGRAMSRLRAESFDLQSDLGRTYVLQLEELDDLPLMCHLRGRDVFCTGEQRTSNRDGRDATVTTAVSVSGRFDTPDTLGGSLGITLGCEGTYCFGLKLTGCTVERSFEAMRGPEP